MSTPGGMFTPERSQRSVFVGNIPYEATEDEMREIFSQVGAVYGFRLVHDRESGKPKGYGFCEYLDQETAQSAMRNLNSYEFRGRQLRVDSATGEKTREELAQLQAALGPPPEENPFGSPCDPEKAPENISRAVASLPPEQMFELMKQMKMCVQNNPNEARNMLLQNPQLAYALLQAQVVMRIVDPQVAMAMLHRPDTSGPTAPVMPPAPTQPPVRPPVAPAAVVQQPGPGPLPPPPVLPRGPMPPMPNPGGSPHMGIAGGLPSAPLPPPPVPSTSAVPLARPAGPSGSGGDMDYRQAGPSNAMIGPQQRPPGPVAVPATTAEGASSRQGGPVASLGGAQNLPADDQEKAQLIMQVLQLTDDQIALLPEEQRQSVLILKEQLKTAQ